MSKVTAVMDIECYKNYFLVMFKRVDTGNTKAYELYDGVTLNYAELRTVMDNYRIVTFNGNGYDIPILTLALTGADCAKLKLATNAIIEGELKPWQFEDQFNIKIPKRWDHIDLIEVAFGQGSLKLYGGRLHSKKLQDLPIEPSALITPEQRAELRHYCHNDLQTTIDLFKHLGPQIELREHMTAEYGEDLRSKSDAQIAEAVLRKQCAQILGAPVQRPTIPPGTVFKYDPPEWLSYTTGELREVLQDVREADFFVAETGSVTLPATLDGRAVSIGRSVYRMGIGGLHSSEQTQAVVACDDMLLVDRDVTSYYPSIILECGLSPSHLERDNAFLRTYRSIVERRVDAKKRGDTVVANVLKIVANGSFGKLGSKYSALYAPKLLIQVTLTGQLALLMLIERLEGCGISVISGNTDGIVINYHKSQESTLLQVLSWWEKTTGFNTEETRYRAIFSRDVNNYVALKEGGGAKGKGAFAPVSISKNPQNQICVDAVIAYLDNHVPVEQTIRNCQDIRRFVTVRTVKGGAAQLLATRYDDSLTPGKKRDLLLRLGWRITTPGPIKTMRLTPPTMGDPLANIAPVDVETAYRMYCGEDKTQYLGKVVRFYIGKSSKGALYYNAKNKTGGRNKVPNSDSAVPVMELPDAFPEDVDYDFYIQEAKSMLRDLGATEQKMESLLFG